MLLIQMSKRLSLMVLGLVVAMAGSWKPGDVQAAPAAAGRPA